MTRVFLTIILPLLLPTAIYVLWAVGFGRAELGGGTAWRGLPWTWLIAAGVALALAVVGLVVQFSGTSGGTYVAPHVENGRIVPGHFINEPQ
jgi:hypothetical protein